MMHIRGIVKKVIHVSGSVNLIPSGGGGADPVIEEKNITDNGTYTAPAGVDGYSPVNVNVPTGPARDASDVSISGRTVNVAPGLYSAQVTKYVPTGTEGTPTANKSISGNTATVTPTVTNGEGYIEGGTKNGTPVTVSAAELASGTKSITENGEGIDVVGYASVDVNVPSQAPVIQSKTITENGTYTPPTGVDGFAPVVVNVQGGGGYHDKTTVSYHTGGNNAVHAIPISDTAKDHYVVFFKAVKSWLKIDGVWTEQESLDFTGASTSALCFFGALSTDKFDDLPFINTSGVETKANRAYMFSRTGQVSATNVSSVSAVGKLTVDQTNQLLSVNLGTNNYVCAATWGCTFEYEVFGWDD